MRDWLAAIIELLPNQDELQKKNQFLSAISLLVAVRKLCKQRHMSDLKEDSALCLLKMAALSQSGEEYEHLKKCMKKPDSL